MRLPAALLATFALGAAPLPPAVTTAASEVLLPKAGVPFGCGLTFPVSQAHQMGSHLQHDSWAWDFRMPEGTPVVAAREGVVRLARGDSSSGGCDARYAPFANYVVVDHGDGLETQYLHFREVVVRPGDRVKAGDLLGYSGKTGWACGAHLHFKVARAAGRSWNNPSVQAWIAGYGDPQVDAQVASPACRTAEASLITRTPPDVAPEPPAPASEPAPEPSGAPTRI